MKGNSTMSTIRTRRVSRRSIAILAAAVTILGAATACAPGGSDNSSDESQDGAVTLKLWDYFGADGTAEKQLLDNLGAYMDEHPDVQIERKFIAYADLKQSLLQSAGAGSLPDIVIINGPDHQQFAELGIAANLDEKVAEWGELDNYAEGVIASAKYNGSIYGLPSSTNCLALFYNKTMLREAGIEPPTTWKEMEAAAAKLTTPEHFGFAYSAVNNQQAVFQWLPALWQGGGDLYDLTAPEAVVSLDYWAGMMDDGSVSKEALNWDQAAVAAEFGQGRAAMMINGPWQLPFLANEASDLDYGVALLPAGEEAASVTGGENFMIMAGPNEDAAWDLLKFLQTPEIATKSNVAEGSLPIRNDIDPFPGNDKIALFTEQLQVANPRAYGASYAEIADQIVVALQSRMTGSANSEQALKTAADAIVDLLPKQ